MFLVEAAPDQVPDQLLTLRQNLGGQVLCATHSGQAACERINPKFHRRFVGTSEDTLHIQRAVGEPVIYGQNDYNRTTLHGTNSILWNGSMGTIKEVLYEPAYSLIVEFDGEDHLLKGDDLSHLQHAFAITVHRAQGSQFPVIFIPLVKARNVDRTGIYTAITRAEHTAILVGPHSAFANAVNEKPHSDHRRVGLNLRL